MDKILLAIKLLVTCTNITVQENRGSKYLKLIETGVFNKRFIRKQPLSCEAFKSVANHVFGIIDNDTSGTPGLSQTEMEVYRNLVKKMEIIDTVDWQDNELTDCVIVSGDGHINEQYAMSKFKPEGKKEVIFYKRLISSFNTAEYGKKWLFTFSRPVIDTSGNYAILADTSKGNNFGCSFYKWNGGNWKEMLSISTRD